MSVVLSSSVAGQEGKSFGSQVQLQNKLQACRGSVLPGGRFCCY